MGYESFTKAPKGMTLEELAQAFQVMAEEVNAERAANGIRGFAKVYTTGVMHNPRDGSLSLVIQFSDHDEVAPVRIGAILKRKRKRKNGHGQHGDPYLA